MYIDNKRIFVALILVLFALLVGEIFITSSTQEESNAASQRLRWFCIEDMMAKAGAKCGCKSCGSTDLSFVEAVGHKDYTSYIFICNSCLQHTEFEPKGIPLSRWDID